MLHRGDALLSPSITRMLWGDISAAGSDTERLNDLTDRELEVLVEVGVYVETDRFGQHC